MKILHDDLARWAASMEAERDAMNGATEPEAPAPKRKAKRKAKASETEAAPAPDAPAEAETPPADASAAPETVRPQTLPDRIAAAVKRARDLGYPDYATEIEESRYMTATAMEETEKELDRREAAKQGDAAAA